MFSEEGKPDNEVAFSLGAREHTPRIQTKAERQENDSLQTIHWVMSQLKRWLIGTHGDAVKPKHLQADLDEFGFRWNRRKTKGVARVAARTIETLVSHAPLTMRAIVSGAVPYPLFAPGNLALPE